MLAVVDEHLADTIGALDRVDLHDPRASTTPGSAPPTVSIRLDDQSESIERGRERTNRRLVEDVDFERGEVLQP